MAPPAFDAVSDSGGGTLSTTTKSWTHTPAGTPTAAKLSVHVGATGATFAATYGGVAMTQVLGGTGVNLMFTLLNPPAGAQTIVVTASAARRFEAGCITYTGVKAFGVPVSATGTGTVASVSVVSRVGDMVADGVTFSGTTAVTSLQTERYSGLFGATATDNIGLGSDAPGAASVAMGYQALLSQPWNIQAIALLKDNTNDALMVISEGA
jgi:hypothetical protein